MHLGFPTGFGSFLEILALPPDELVEGLLLVSLGVSRPLFVPGLPLLDFIALDLAELSSASRAASGLLGGLPLLDALSVVSLLFNPFLLYLFQVGHLIGLWLHDPQTWHFASSG